MLSNGIPTPQGLGLSLPEQTQHGDSSQVAYLQSDARKLWEAAGSQAENGMPSGRCPLWSLGPLPAVEGPLGTAGHTTGSPHSREGHLGRSPTTSTPRLLAEGIDLPCAETSRGPCFPRVLAVTVLLRVDLKARAVGGPPLLPRA